MDEVFSIGVNMPCKLIGAHLIAHSHLVQLVHEWNWCEHAMQINWCSLNCSFNCNLQLMRK